MAYNEWPYNGFHILFDIKSELVLKLDQDIINEYDIIYNPDIIDEYIENWLHND